ncbi:MAG TPA: helix-turn-helix transcriptional regulator, partial [Candidatus Nesterenkonia stercoripullorum]|nr:helix-turn-helix transcriptional regulator [Candidatus Nesterenkonia stercoripullorum]
RRLTLNDVAQEAGLSSQYLSEIERGRKEPSSEMIAAISGALGITLVELTVQVADELRRDTLSFVGFAPSASPADTTVLPPSSEALPAPTSHTISAGPSAAVQLCVAA